MNELHIVTVLDWILLILLAIFIQDILTGLTIIPLFWKDVKWTVFIFRTRNRWIKLDNNHFLVKTKDRNYVIFFLYSWLFEVYEGSTSKEINNKYSLGGQSNKADYLTFWQKWIGIKIEQRYKYYCLKK
ncbi:MAG: hypothetical protein PHT07_15540 [Paludibacter sp.]|nr:hypothetical protein [Paludibacter sp.]